jgi:hypothetical protein
MGGRPKRLYDWSGGGNMHRRSQPGVMAKGYKNRRFSPNPDSRLKLPEPVANTGFCFLLFNKKITYERTRQIPQQRFVL